MAQSWVGRTIGNRYQLEDLLGAGGMSSVYRALDPNLRRVVAVKLIHPHLSVNPNFVDRFKEEAAAVASLRHPNIVQVHDFNNEGETYYMVMEYLAGETLQAHLRRINAVGRQMPLKDVTRICLQVCDAAGYAHRHDLVHRDIKPANIMLDVNDQAILMDFGIVKIVGGQYHTATGATLGTAVYMSPEQIRGERVDGRSDIYSLGVMLYEMLSGRPPYEADSALTLMMMHLNDPIPDPGQLRPDVPPELTAVITRALAKKTQERYQTVEEMSADLQQIEAQLLSASHKAESSPQPKTELFKQSEAGLDQLISRSEQPSPVSEPLGSDTLPMDEEGTPQIIETEPATEQTPGKQSDLKHPPEAPTQQSNPSGNQLMEIGAHQEEPSASASLPTPFDRRREEKRNQGVLRWLVPVVGIFVIVLLGVAGVWLYIQRRPPPLQLVPIEHPSTSIDVESQGKLVNLGTWKIDSSIAELAFSPDSILLATASNRDWVHLSPFRFYASLWEVVPGQLHKNLTSHDDYMNSLAFSPDGLTLTTASEDAYIKFWNVSDGTPQGEIQSSAGGVLDLAFSPSGELIAGGTWEGIALWQVSNGNLLRTYKSNEAGIKSVAFSPDGNLLAGASDQGDIYLWQVIDGTLLHTLTAHTEQINQVIFSPDGSTLATASDDKTVRLWRVGDGEVIALLAGHTEGVSSVAFSLDGTLLASGSWDNTLRLWQANDGLALQTIEINDSINDLAFSPDGVWLVIAVGEGGVNFFGVSDVLSSVGEIIRGNKQ